MRRRLLGRGGGCCEAALVDTHPVIAAVGDAGAAVARGGGSAAAAACNDLGGDTSLTTADGAVDNAEVRAVSTSRPKAVSMRIPLPPVTADPAGAFVVVVVSNDGESGDTVEADPNSDNGEATTSGNSAQSCCTIWLDVFADDDGGGRSEARLLAT